MELTQKQQEVLDFIHAYFAKQGMAPSVREIAEALGKSAQAIQQHGDVAARDQHELRRGDELRDP